MFNSGFPAHRLLTLCFVLGTSIGAASQAAATGARPTTRQYPPGASAEAQPVPAEVNVQVDRSLHADIVQDSPAPVPGKIDNNPAAAQFARPAIVPQPVTQTTTWVPQRITALSTAPTSPLTVGSTPSPLVLPAPVIYPLALDADRTPSQPPHGVAPTRIRDRAEIARSQARASQKQFHQQCSRLGLTDYECRIKQKNTLSVPIDAALQREKTSAKQSPSP